MRARLGKRRQPKGKKRVWRRNLKLRTLPLKEIVVKCDHKFALFGCWGKDCEEGSAQQLIANHINEKGDIDFMVTAGDNFYVKDISKVDFEKNVTHCYSKPMYAAMGNHDIAFYNKEMEFQNPNWILPAKNYIIKVVTRGGAPRLRIVMINTNPIYAEKDYGKNPLVPKDQHNRDMVELNNFLEQLPSSDLFTIIVGHHPLVFNRHKEKSLPRFMDDFGRMISSKCNLYVCADEHNLQHIVYENLNQFILGGGGGDPDENIIMDYPEQTKFAHGFHGYGVFDVRKMKMTIKCMEKVSGSITSCYKYSL